MPARIRFFCVLGPRGGKSVKGWWPDVSWLYLKALIDGEFAVRALPIGASYMNIPPSDPGWRHWKKVMHLFTEQLDADYVNVVCAPPGMVMGSRKTRGQLSPARMEELDNMVPGHPGAGAVAVHREMTAAAAASDAEEVVYEPSTALSSLWTEGKKNIAITGVSPKPPDENEIEALSRYDHVLSPTPNGAMALVQAGVDAIRLAPRELPICLRAGFPRD